MLSSTFENNKKTDPNFYAGFTVTGTRVMVSIFRTVGYILIVDDCISFNMCKRYYRSEFSKTVAEINQEKR